jgi:LPS export ABC transporter protein LptC
MSVLSGQKKIWIAGMVVLIGAGVGWGWARKSSTEKPVISAPETPAPGGDQVSVFTLVGHTETGRRKWEVEGETADLTGQMVQLSPVKAISYGKVDIQITAQRGRFHKKSKNVHLRGNVVAITSDDSRLETEVLDWNQLRESATTKWPVKMLRVGMTATGKGAVAYPKRKWVKLFEKVTVTMQDPKSTTVVTCDGSMEVDYARNKARFWKNVKVTDARGTITSDRLDLNLNPKTHQMDRAIFWGRVRIDHGNEVAYANRVNYWQPLGYVRLIGHPKLVLTPEQEP